MGAGAAGAGAGGGHGARHPLPRRHAQRLLHLPQRPGGPAGWERVLNNSKYLGFFVLTLKKTLRKYVEN